MRCVPFYSNRKDTCLPAGALSPKNAPNHEEMEAQHSQMQQDHGQMQEEHARMQEEHARMQQEHAGMMEEHRQGSEGQ